MRKTTVVTMSIAALAGGVALAGSATALGQSPSGDQAHNPLALARALEIFRSATVHDAYNTTPARLRQRGTQVETFKAQVAALDRAHPEGSEERDRRTMRNLAQIEDHMDRYLAHGADGEERDMQNVVWRFLWVHNTLPMSVIAPDRS